MDKYFILLLLKCNKIENDRRDFMNITAKAYTAITLQSLITGFSFLALKIALRRTLWIFWLTGLHWRRSPY